MRIVNRKDFLALPKGTVYAKIPERWIVNDLCVKYDTIGKDWYSMSFDWIDAGDSNEAIDRLEAMDKKPDVSFPVQNSISRDGLFEETDKFLIYEREDINFIISELTRKQTEQNNVHTESNNGTNLSTNTVSHL